MSNLTSDEQYVPFPSWEAWNEIRNGRLMPFLESDRELYESQKRFAAEHIKYTNCVGCTHRFSDENCFTEDGWKETQLSGLCERCFDDATMEEEYDVGDEGEEEDDEWDGDEDHEPW